MRKSWRAVGLLMIASIVPFSGWRQASADEPAPCHLLAAGTDQTPMTSAYSALNVPALAAGSYYPDPRTQVKVYKLTSATFPTTGFSWGHAYSEGGDEVSLPYNGSTRTIHLTTIDGFHWLIDFNPSTGVSNWRKLTGTISPWTDLAFAFSNNPATPNYAYIAGWDGAIHQVDFTTCTQTQACTEIMGNGWPLVDDLIYRPSWMHQSKNDGLFVWMRGNTDVVVAYHPASGTRKTYNECAINEPRIDREGRYIGLTMDDPQNGIVVLDFGSADPPDRYAPMTVVQRADGTVPFAHVASLRDRWLGVDWNLSFPTGFTKFTPLGPTDHIGGPANGSLIYGNGNWIQEAASLENQWALFSSYGGLVPDPAWSWLSPGGMVFITPGGERRLLGHPYNTSEVYNFYSFAKLSPDGRYVLFTSNMNDQCSNTACNGPCWADGTHPNAGTKATQKVQLPSGCEYSPQACETRPCGRSDVFLAEVPTGQACF